MADKHAKMCIIITPDGGASPDPAEATSGLTPGGPGKAGSDRQVACKPETSDAGFVC